VTDLRRKSEASFTNILDAISALSQQKHSLYSDMERRLDEMHQRYNSAMIKLSDSDNGYIKLKEKCAILEENIKLYKTSGTSNKYINNLKQKYEDALDDLEIRKNLIGDFKAKLHRQINEIENIQKENMTIYSECKQIRAQLNKEIE